MTVCPQCGAQNLPGMAYCEHCGSPLSVPEQAPAAAAPSVDVGDSSADAAIAQAQAVLKELDASNSAAAASVPAQQPVAVPAPPEDVAEAPPVAPSRPDLPETAVPLDSPADIGAPVLVFTFPNNSEFTMSVDAVNVGRSDVAQNWHPELDVIPYAGGAPDLGVSRHQALIQRNGSSFTIVDVGSTNGTFVNGRALEYNTSVDLHDGDSVAFGAFSTKISIRS